jgi:hypothetical protein
VRQIRMLRAKRRELETGLRRLLHGHEGGNPGYGQGAAYGLPRQFPTLPTLREPMDQNLRREFQVVNRDGQTAFAASPAQNAQNIPSSRRRAARHCGTTACTFSRAFSA